MNWQALLNPEIQNFILTHENEDVSKLALQKPPVTGWPMPLILEQINARQKGLKKIPHWASVKNIVFPAADLVEQASSYACAAYKASLVKGEIFADLTAGCGIDSAAFAQKFAKGIAVEMDEDHSDILAHNLMVSGEDHILVKHDDSSIYLKSMPEVDVIYIDPQRRDGKRRGIYALTECSPNIITMMPDLKKKTKFVIVKTSPILDIQKTITDLGNVSAVHIVEYQGECKEVLYVLDFENRLEPENIPITCVAIDDLGHPLQKLGFTASQEQNASYSLSLPQKYLYEPSPAFMKGGAYKHMAAHYRLEKLAENTHLYTSEKPVPNFPGRLFEIQAQCAVKDKEIKKILPSMKANLTLRNFPSSTEDLRKKLKLKDGGDTYLFACQDKEESKIVIICKKYAEKEG